MQKDFENFPDDRERAQPLSQVITLKKDTKMDIPKTLTTKEKRKILKDPFFKEKISKISSKKLISPNDSADESMQHALTHENELETLSTKLDTHFKPLQDLLELIKIHYYNQPELHNKVLFLYHKACDTSSQKEVSKSQVCKLLFLIDKYPECINEIFKGNQVDIIKNMKSVFYQQILKIKENIYHNNNIDSNLPSKELVPQNNLPAIIVDLLWTSSGRLNIGIIEKLKTAFFPMKGISKLHQEQMMFVLDCLTKNSELTLELLSIHREHREELQIDHAVRAQLSLPNSVSITPLHLQKVALISLLSHPRQNQAGSCFASFLPISLLTMNPLRALKDLKCLLTKDCLEYTSPQNVTTQIPYNMVISSDEMEKIFHIDHKGHFFYQEKDMGTLASLPGWISVCRGLGIKNPENALVNLLKNFNFSREKGDIVIKNLVMALCRSVGDPENLRETYSLAKFYYKSVTNPPLLACWENAIAAICESQANSYLKSILANSLIPNVLKEFEKKLTNSTLEDNSASKLVVNALSSFFHRSTRLTYDPEAKGSEDCVEGGFVLEEITDKGWIRIEDEIDFLNFISHLLEKVAKIVETSSISKASRIDLHKAIESIMKNIKTDSEWRLEWILQITEMFKNILKNQIKKTPSINISTPWSMLVGHDADQVLQLYFGRIPKKTEFIPRNGEEAMKHLFSTERKQDDMMLNHQVQLPFRIQGFHACTFISSPSLYQGNEEKKKDIIENLKELGEKISSNKIPEPMMECLHKICMKWVKKKDSELHKEIQNLSEDLSIYDYRNKIISIYAHYLKESVLKEFERELDSAIIASLPIHLKKSWLSIVVPFADTNWHRGTKDIYFCFAYNLGTRMIELWKIDENKENVKAISTDKIFNTPWQIYYPPI